MITPVDLVLDLWGAASPVLRRFWRQLAAIALIGCVYLSTEWPEHPTTAPARFVSCGWLDHAIDGARAGLEVVFENTAEPRTGDKLPAPPNPLPWCR